MSFTRSELLTLCPRKESRLLDMAWTDRQAPKGTFLWSYLNADISWGVLLEGYLLDGLGQALICYKILKLAV